MKKGLIFLLSLFLLIGCTSVEDVANKAIEQVDKTSNKAKDAVKKTADEHVDKVADKVKDVIRTETGKLK